MQAPRAAGITWLGPPTDQRPRARVHRERRAGAARTGPHATRRGSVRARRGRGRRAALTARWRGTRAVARAEVPNVIHSAVQRGEPRRWRRPRRPRAVALNASSAEGAVTGRRPWRRSPCSAAGGLARHVNGKWSGRAFSAPGAKPSGSSATTVHSSRGVDRVAFSDMSRRGWAAGFQSDVAAPGGDDVAAPKSDDVGPGDDPTAGARIRRGHPARSARAGPRRGRAHLSEGFLGDIAPVPTTAMIAARHSRAATSRRHSLWRTATWIAGGRAGGPHGRWARAGWFAVWPLAGVQEKARRAPTQAVVSSHVPRGRLRGQGLVLLRGAGTSR